MKKTAVFLLALLLIACQAAPTDTSYESPAPQTNEEVQLSAKVLDNLSLFSWKTVGEIMSGEENANYSPISLYLALSMLLPGSANQSEAKLSEFLSLKKEDVASLRNLALELEKEGESFRITSGNSLWVDKSFPLNPDYAKNITENFYADLYNLDFKDPSSGKKISAAIKKQTQGLLEPDLGDVKDWLLGLVNTLYLKDAWNSPFRKEDTKQEDFTDQKGAIQKKDFMHQQLKNYYYVKDDQVEGIRLYLSSGANLLLLKPENKDVKSLLKNPKLLEQYAKPEQSTKADVLLALPKLDLNSDMTLKESLSSMGLEELFTDNADFSGISKTLTKISTVRQFTKLTMDEQGIEAAAATVIGMEKTAMPEPLEKIEMRMDSPFIMILFSPSGIPLFISTVVQ